MGHYKNSKRRKRREIKLNNLRKQVRIHWAHLVADIVGNMNQEDSVLAMLKELDTSKFEEGKEYEWVLQSPNKISGNKEGPEVYTAGVDPYNIEHLVELGADPRKSSGELIFHGEGLRAQISKSNKITITDEK